MQGTSMTKVPVVYEVECTSGNKLSTTIYEPIIQAIQTVKQIPTCCSLEKKRKSVHHNTLSHLRNFQDALISPDAEDNSRVLKRLRASKFSKGGYKALET